MPSCSSLLPSCPAETSLLPPLWPRPGSSARRPAAFLLYYYLPMALADWMGFYKDEGLDVKVVDFQGGSKSLQAVVGGSADVVSGAFEHTLSMQTKRQSMQAFVLQDRAPQCVFAINRRTMKGVKDPAALKGRRIGVTAPGSHSHVMANFVMARAGVKPNEYSAIGIGSGAS